MEYLSICNKYGEKCNKVAERNEAHEQGLSHRVFHLWIINSLNQVLVQQRSSRKIVGANLCYASVAGHICSDESTELSILREAKEEIGVDISSLSHNIDYLL